MKSNDTELQQDLHVENDDSKPLYLKRGLRTLACHLLLWILASVYIGYASFRNQRETKDGFFIIIVVYFFFTIRLAALHVSLTRLVYKPIAQFFTKGSGVLNKIRPEVRLMCLAASLVLVILICVFTIPETDVGTSLQRLQSCGGIVVCLGALWLSSDDRRLVNWRTVVVGMTLNYAIALFVLKTDTGIEVFLCI
jgi:CNT family concentrative nucleoside transporter